MSDGAAVDRGEGGSRGGGGSRGEGGSRGGGGSRGRILVVGGGISGITAAVEAAEAGTEVVLVEKSPFLGGRVARTNQYFPKMCPPQCGLEINLRRVKTNPLIRVLTLAEVEKIEGAGGATTAGGGIGGAGGEGAEAGGEVPGGRFHVTIRQNPRFVTEKCTVCGDCVDACPVERADAFNLGLGTTKAIHLPYEAAYPMRMVIDADACGRAACGVCVPACPFDAIDLDMAPTTVEVDVQSVILATGWDPYDAGKLGNLGFGAHPDVVTNVMMERMAAPNGPTGGRILRPSDGEPPRSVAFVQCAGSRDENHLKHCSGVCCMGSLKQARYVRDQHPDADVWIFYIDIRSPGRLEDFYQARQADEKIHLVKGKVGRVAPEDGGLLVEAEDTLTGHRMNRQVDLVVLATGMVASETGDLGLPGGLRRDDHGFLARQQPTAGIFAAGCAARPTDVATCVRDATGAVMHALQLSADPIATEQRLG